MDCSASSQLCPNIPRSWTISHNDWYNRAGKNRDLKGYSPKKVVNMHYIYICSMCVYIYILTILTIVDIPMSNTCIAAVGLYCFATVHVQMIGNKHIARMENRNVIWLVLSCEEKSNAHSFKNRFSPSNLHSCIPCGVWSIVNHRDFCESPIHTLQLFWFWECSHVDADSLAPWQCS